MGKNSTVLVLGATGMLGSAVLRFFAKSAGFSVIGSVRSSNAIQLLPRDLHGSIVTGIDVMDMDSVLRLFDQARPDIVVNCVGLVKQLAESSDPLASIPLNALFPHQLLRLCKVAGARLIHISTDCVFDGAKGMYTESDVADARDMYGLSKYLGEVRDSEAITLRTSIIGPELNSAHGLVSWFLDQGNNVKGFTRAIFSGLPTVELARIMRDYIIPRHELNGLYHVSANPISKYDLLLLIAHEYRKLIDIAPQAEPALDRSLDSTRFRKHTSYVPPSWPELVRTMHEFG
ncbi:MAG TPA: SDR family oxidoreductase [Steroidobacteraceae bacterium]|jgi:dTDP-4-dehydrorhamnose reductase|nr:SDR family oxidoreductase [Steroidobacteraceae bacterium]